MKKALTMPVISFLLLPLLVLLPHTTFGAATTSIQVLSATVKDKPIAGAEVIFQKNGENSVTNLTGADGRVRTATNFGADDTSVLLIIKKAGYSTLIVKCPCNDLTYALSETMTQLDGMRIVLAWGKHPVDMDAHLVFPGNHIFFKQTTGEHAWLDVDNRKGFGPETITIDRRINGLRYLYAVHNFADSDEFTSRKYTTQAKVQVYVGSSLVRTYYFVPREVNSMVYLFGINEYGEIYDINRYETHVIGLDGLKNSLAAAFGNDNFSRLEETTTQIDVDSAKQLNAAGEAAYHRKDLESAIDFYRRAIELYPDYGQAYSNLGLAYQKTNRVAEALWANRKAIMLAEGSKRNVVRASSYYNIARIYESQNQWDSALQNYEWAEQQKHNKVYVNAINRMREKIGKR
jgi:hypothetical protein